MGEVREYDVPNEAKEVIDPIGMRCPKCKNVLVGAATDVIDDSKSPCCDEPIILMHDNVDSYFMNLENFPALSQKYRAVKTIIYGDRKMLLAEYDNVKFPIPTDVSYIYLRLQLCKKIIEKDLNTRDDYCTYG